MRIRLWSVATTLAVLASGTSALTPATATATPTANHPTAVGEQGPLPLERHFDNRAVSSERSPTDADFDGAGNSLTENDLKAAGWAPGQRLELDAARLRWPDRSPGSPDNVRSNGQHVALRGQGDAISFLVAASSPHGPGESVTASGTVHYADGSSSPYRLTAEDWRAGKLTTKALALPRINTAAGPRAEKARLYAVTVPLDEGRAVESLTLPADPGPDADIHVFALSVRTNQSRWTGSWAASTGGYTEVGPWRDRTLRLVVRTSSGGDSARIRLANTFAEQPLDIGQVSLAVRGEGATATERPLSVTFDGERQLRVPAGAEAVSDPIPLRLPADTSLLVSLHLPGSVEAAPVHTEAIQRSYLTADGSGDLTGQRADTGFSPDLDFWPFLTGVDVSGGPGSVVALGDSITDGVTSTEGANRRWPDVLSRRLQGQPADSRVPAYGVLNHGISANRVVSDRYDGDGVDEDTAGVSIQNRLDRDVFAQTDVRTVVLFAGINDVRWGAEPEEVIAGMREIADRARARGVRVIAATLTPCEGYQDCSAEVDDKRTTVNDFLRGQNQLFDDVLDFDAALRDPDRPARMLPRYDSGDHLHPGDAGLAALAESIDLRTLSPGAG